MRSIKTVALGLALAAVSASPASAAQVVFTFAGSVTSASTPGVSVGDAVTIRIFADNGGSSLANQTFVYADLQSIELVSGSYQASYSTAFDGGPGTGFSTDGSGQVSVANFLGSTTGTNQDNFGLNNGVYLYNGAFSDYNYNYNYIGGAFSNPGSYTVDFAPIAAVPEPGAWAMMIVGFGVMGAGMRRARRTRAHLAFA